MSELLYFAYGSNLDAEQMSERCPDSEPRFRARLHDHRLDFTHWSRRWSGGAADLRPHPNGVVWGVVYRLERDHLALLDRYEGGYDRVELDVVEDTAERVHRVISYSVRDKQLFRPSAVYIEKMLRWGEHWSFPTPYLELLRMARSLPAGVPPRPTRSQPRPR